jgi:hypothetical protein
MLLLVQALPKPPTEAEMQELLRAMELDAPAPGSAGADQSQDMRFSFHLTVSKLMSFSPPVSSYTGIQKCFNICF